MYGVEVYEQVRRAHLVNGESQRSIARQYGISRVTVKKMIETPCPPGYRRQQEIGLPSIAAYSSRIDQILIEDKKAPRKQRHTARRIHRWLQEEHDYHGSYSAVQRYVKKHRPQMREVFIPLAHAYGTAQADFGEAYVIMAGEKTKVHYCVISLVNSGQYFVQAYPKENAQTFSDAHIKTFAFFEGVPLEILYDNSGVIVRLEGKEQIRHLKTTFCQLRSHYLFEAEFCAPGKGNEKGHVENKIGTVRRNFFTPVPIVESFEDLNEQLKNFVLKQQAANKSDEEKQCCENDLRALLSLPNAPFEACHTTHRQVNKMCLVRYKGNEYSVPAQYAYQTVTLKAFYDTVKVYAQTTLIANHKRNYKQGEMVLNFQHYLEIICRKIKSVHQAKPLTQIKWPPCFKTLHDRLRAQEGKEGSRQYIKVLQLLETFQIEQVSKAIEQSLLRGRYDSASIRQFILCREDKRPQWLQQSSLQKYPPSFVAPPNLSAYERLREGVSNG